MGDTPNPVTFITLTWAILLSFSCPASEAVFPFRPGFSPEENIRKQLFEACESGSELTSSQKEQVQTHVPAQYHKRILQFSSEQVKRAAAQRLMIFSPSTKLTAPSCDSPQQPGGWEFANDYELGSIPSLSEISRNTKAEFGNSILFLGVQHTGLMPIGSKEAHEANAWVEKEIKDSQARFFILEGFPGAQGINPCSAIVSALFPRNAEDNQSEITVGILAALEMGIPFQGGEVENSELLALSGNPSLKSKMKYSYPRFDEKDYQGFLQFFEFSQHIQVLARNVASSEHLDPPITFEKLDGASLNPELKSRLKADQKSVSLFFKKFENKDLAQEDLATLYDRYMMRTSADPKRDQGILALFSFYVEARDAYLRNLILSRTRTHGKTGVSYGSGHLVSNKKSLLRATRLPNLSDPQCNKVTGVPSNLEKGTLLESPEAATATQSIDAIPAEGMPIKR